METTAFESVFSSAPFRFSVGPNGREFFIHSAVVACQSQPLYSLVHGNFSEAKTNHAVLDTVDELTFVLFCEYAYTGNYGVKANEPPPAPPPAPPPPPIVAFLNQPIAEPEPVDIWGNPTSKKSKRKKRSSIWDEVVDNPPPGPVARQKWDSLWTRFKSKTYVSSDVNSKLPPYKETEFKGLGNFLLVHARVYLLADCYMVSNLASLSIHRLHQSLCVYDVREDTLENIVELLRFTFEEDTPDLIRSLISLFTSCHIEKLWPHKGFRDILRTYEDLFERVIGSTLDRLD